MIPDGKWHDVWIEDENFGPVLFSYNISEGGLDETIAALEAFQRKLDTLERKDGWITLQVGQAVRETGEYAYYGDATPELNKLGIISEVIIPGMLVKVAWQGRGIEGISTALLEPVTLLAKE